MDIHKITEHEYCERCDEDFPDEERLLLHKIISVKHIVCPVCGLEFRSSGGRDVHIRQVSDQKHFLWLLEQSENEPV